MRSLFYILLLIFTSSNLMAASLEVKQKTQKKLRIAAPVTAEDHIIRIGFFYTQDLLEQRSVEALTDYVNVQINAANVVMENSGLAIRRQAGYIGPYPISNSDLSIRDFLATIFNNDAQLVHDIADQFGLDYITILRPHIGNSYCGWAYYTVPYAVMELGGNCTSETLGAHEWGHNDGADHDIANASDTPTRDYGRGYNCNGNGTIMSTSNNWFTRHNFYSSPNHQSGSEPCGQTDKADVTRMLDELKELPNHLGNRKPSPITEAIVKFASATPLQTSEGNIYVVPLTLVDADGNATSLATDASIEVVSASDTAIGGLDYEQIATRVTFLAGESTKQFELSTLTDNKSEPQEQFSLSLRHGDIIEPSTELLTVNIAENEGQIINYSFARQQITLSENETIDIVLSRQGDNLIAEDFALENSLKALSISETLVSFAAEQALITLSFSANSVAETQTGTVNLVSLTNNNTVASIQVTIAPENKISPSSSGGALSIYWLLILSIFSIIPSINKPPFR